MGRSTGSDAWALLGGLGLGLAFSGALRGRRRHRLRSVLVALGLNVAAGALVGELLALGEPGGRGDLGMELILAGAAFVVGTLAFHFPKSVGLPIAVLAAGGVWLVLQAVEEFRPLEDFSPPQIQPLTDRETVTSFVLRADFLELPEGFPLAPKVLLRLRPSVAEPAEWWWSWVASRGWARSVGAALPEDPIKFGVYRLALHNGDPVWMRQTPVLSPSEE